MTRPTRRVREPVYTMEEDSDLDDFIVHDESDDDPSEEDEVEEDLESEIQPDIEEEEVAEMDEPTAEVEEVEVEVEDDAALTTGKLVTASDPESHAAIMTGVMFGSKTIAFQMGAFDKPDIFYVPAELLKFHSVYFQENFEWKFKSLYSNSPVLLSDFNPLAFAQFHCWMIYGFITQPLLNQHCDNQPQSSFTGLWLLGKKCGSPNFQNFVMDNLRQQASNGLWPTPLQVAHIWSSEVVQSNDFKLKLTEFTAACLNVKNPFRDGERDQEGWMKVFEGCKELSLAVALAGARKWDTSAQSSSAKTPKMPWDDECRESFMESAETLNGKMRAMLKTKNEEGTKKAAEGGCIKSMLDLPYIRPEPVVETQAISQDEVKSEPGETVTKATRSSENKRKAAKRRADAAARRSKKKAKLAVKKNK